MNLPKVLSNLIAAQNKHESAAYVQCFSEKAIVFDEGKTHQGSVEIQQWIAKANEEYKVTVTPLEYDALEKIMLAEVSGTFPGSPIVLKYHFEFANDQISSLRIVG